MSRTPKLRSTACAVGLLALLAGCSDDGCDCAPPPAPEPLLAVVAGRPGGPGLLDGPGAEARFDTPTGIAIDAGGALYVADTGNLAVRRVAPDGTVSTLAGGPYAFDADAGTGTFLKVDRVAVGAGGRVFALDTDYARLFEILSDGSARPLFGAPVPQRICSAGSCAVGRLIGRRPHDLALDGAGHVVVTASFVGIAETDVVGGVPVVRSVERIERYDIDSGAYSFWIGGGPAFVDGPVAQAQVVRPRAIGADPGGTLHLSDAFAVRRIERTTDLVTVAGTLEAGSVDGTGAAARFRAARAIAAGGTGDALVMQDDGALRRVTPAGVASTVAGAPGTPAAGLLAGVHGLAVAASGTVFVADRGAHRLSRLDPDGTLAGIAGSAVAVETGRVDAPGAAARFNGPSGVAVDPSGTVYVADTDNHVIRRIAPDGSVSTLAGAAAAQGSVDGVGVEARFTRPRAIAVDAAGALYVVDATPCALRVVTPAGVVSTQQRADGGCFADDAPAQALTAQAVATGADGSVYVAYFQRIGRRDTRGRWSLVAQPGYLEHLAAGRNGTLYAASVSGGVVLRIGPGGGVSELAGTPVSGQAPPADGVGAAARFASIGGLALDAQDRVLVSDANRLRRIDPGGAVTTVLGRANAVGVRPGPAAGASLHRPAGLAVAADGAVYGADAAEHLVFRAVLPP